MLLSILFQIFYFDRHFSKVAFDSELKTVKKNKINFVARKKPRIEIFEKRTFRTRLAFLQASINLPLFLANRIKPYSFHNKSLRKHLFDVHIKNEPFRIRNKGVFREEGW